ncbi:recombinase family protein, partial [Eubacteriales bacterium OttesenSCG-928-N14]|nr:recombinase family protein [Eubacteriales bacterium OttesenSCG-928-N14]
ESIEGQLRDCKAFAEKNGITIFGTYIDRALSAKTDNRPQFQKMIKDSGKHLFDVVLVWKLDRFARNRYDSAQHKNTLKKNGVKVISATEQIAEDSTGILIESILEGYAEYYSVELAEKVKRGQRENALKAKYNGGGLPIGYVRNSEQRYEIDPIVAPVVLEAFKKYSKGELIKDIRDWMNGQGIRTKYGNPLNINAVTRMLKNRRYMGEYYYGGITHEDAIPAIVDKKLFERVQVRMEKNKRAPARHKAEDDYLLTTKLRCGYCGAFMVGESGRSKTGKVHHYYKCVSDKKGRGCKKKPVRKAWIEDLVIEQLVEIIMDDALLEQIADMVMDVQGRESVTLPMLRQQLAEVERGLDNLVDAIQQGMLTPTTKKRLDELEKAKSDIEVAILQEELERPLLKREQVLFFLHRFRKLDVTKQEHRQRLVDSFINTIYLYDDKIVFTFNYKDDTKTISLDDVSKELGSDLESSPPPAASRRSQYRKSRLWPAIFLCTNAAGILFANTRQ